MPEEEFEMEEEIEEQIEEEKPKNERKMYKAVCSECGKDTEVPFEPDPNRPVYCKDCFMKKRRSRFRGSNRGFNRNYEKKRDKYWLKINQTFAANSFYFLFSKIRT